MINAFRSTVFNIVMILSAIIYAVISILFIPFSYRHRYFLITRWNAFILWFLRLSCGLSYRVEGREHIKNGPYIIMSKHQSSWETILYPVIFPHITYVLKRELIWLPFFGWGLAQTEPIAIDRGAGHRAITQIVEKGIDRLKKGRWIVIFPEGTRVAPGKIGRYGIGGAILAERSGYPVLPIAIDSGRYWGRRSYVKTPGVMRVKIGPEISTQGKTAEQIREEVKTWIEAQLKNE